MTKETQDNYNHLAPYADVAGDVVALIGDRGQANGDPEVFGSVLGGLLEVYNRAVVPTRPFGGADAFVLQILESVAYIASGGVQAQRFRDMALAAIAGSVHVERVVQAMRARQAAESGQEAAPEEPDDGEGFRLEPGYQGPAVAEPELPEDDDQEGDPRAAAVEVERERAAAVRSTPEGMDPDDAEGDPRAQGVEGRMGYA